MSIKEANTISQHYSFGVSIKNQLVFEEERSELIYHLPKESLRLCFFVEQIRLFFLENGKNFFVLSDWETLPAYSFGLLGIIRNSTHSVVDFPVHFFPNTTTKESERFAQLLFSSMAFGWNGEWIGTTTRDHLYTFESLIKFTFVSKERKLDFLAVAEKFKLELLHPEK